MKCNAAPATRKLHQAASRMKIHRRLSTHLYGTCQAGRITGSSLTIAGSVVSFIPVVGWFAGPALIAGISAKRFYITWVSTGQVKMGFETRVRLKTSPNQLQRFLSSANVSEQLLSPPQSFR